jgi:hypothetical protein
MRKLMAFLIAMSLLIVPNMALAANQANATNPPTNTVIQTEQKPTGANQTVTPSPNASQEQPANSSNSNKVNGMFWLPFALLGLGSIVVAIFFWFLKKNPHL